MNLLTLIANLPFVQLCFLWDTERWAFSRFYIASQRRSPELLSFRDTIDRYKRSSYSELAAELPELWKEAAGL